VAFLDADDLMLPHKLTAQVRYLTEHPDVGCVLARQDIRIEGGVEPPAWLRRDRLIGDLAGVGPLSAVVPRRVIDLAGGFDPEYRVAEGLEWLGRLREAGVRVSVLPDVVMIRRVHDANLTNLNADLVAGVLRGLKGRMDRSRAREQTR
jgi:hypothetical protein